MAKGHKGGHIDFAPHLDKPKNMPGDMPMHAISKKFGGKRLKPHESGPMHKEGGDPDGKGHGLHGAKKKQPKMTSKHK